MDTENTNKEPVQDVAVSAEPAEDPSVIGRLSPEEHSTLMKIRAESQQLLAKIGEQELIKLKLLSRIEELDGALQQVVNAVSERLGLEDGQQWAGLGDGTIRLVTPQGVQQGGSSPG